MDSAKNRADSLTRVPRSWLKHGPESDQEDGRLRCMAARAELVAKQHGRHYLGVDRTLYLARLEDPQVTRDDVVDVVSRCARCWQIDPAHVSWQRGDLSVVENWIRRSANVIHYGGRCYVSVVDCGPSRFAVWRCIPVEQMEAIRAELERGPLVELLMDNSSIFRSSSMRQALLDKWGVTPLYRAAYKPSGNGIVERNHQAIKRMAARSNSDPLDMVFW